MFPAALRSHERITFMDDAGRPNNDLWNLDDDDTYSLNSAGSKRPRRYRKHSEAVLSQAAVEVWNGNTFSIVSEKYNIPRTTLQNFMRRHGLLKGKKEARRSFVQAQIQQQIQLQQMEILGENQQIVPFESGVDLYERENQIKLEFVGQGEEEDDEEEDEDEQTEEPEFVKLDKGKS